MTTLASSSATLILAHSSPTTQHPYSSLFIPDTPASGPLHKLLFLLEMRLTQILQSSPSSPSSICSNVIHLSSWSSPSQSDLIFNLPLTPIFLITLFLLYFFYFFDSTHHLLKYEILDIVCLSLLTRTDLHNAGIFTHFDHWCISSA